MTARILLLGALTLSTACATVPKDAPVELHNAKASIDRANKGGAEAIVPKTMKQADKRLDNAVATYKKSVKGDGDQELLSDAKKEALAATKMADNAAALNADVRTWDGGDLDAYASLKNKETVTTARNEENTTQYDNDVAAAPILNLTQPIAFFSTAQSDLTSATMAQLVAALKNSPDLHVTLIGYADRRGTKQFNEELSKSRAENVANYLASQGIARDRINVQAVGAEKAIAQPNDQAALQLDRKVEVEFRSLAH